ncbi:hypothetical protein D1632_10695 [Chryseobacterium nematophagum]|uniref:Uncharacterized protein n=1 Tax=Chryseobacterium nematophagum TaxID=2305228 RepID=A0A3M7LBA5_9FLAO|nr:hypothetical protein D1632_10695 [Chryseobacterium nematophagum]
MLTKSIKFIIFIFKSYLPQIEYPPLPFGCKVFQKGLPIISFKEVISTSWEITSYKIFETISLIF